ncbi:lipoprotein [uncultured Psychrobacter sp.]|uniref:LPS translocon maturation chaperone LptM n=1 Tax=uncultured Psychrobacter sp. TaxID=259303 RepID=UPI00262349A5|nr:lipoprotein [uncultured Psychrobacter sp.]
MFTIRRSLDIRGTQNLSANSGRHAIWTLMIGSAVMLGLSGCGQKGDLYLAEPSSQTVAALDQLDSTSHPQDAAFATIDDDNYDKSSYLEQQQVLPSASDDPNDY